MKKKTGHWVDVAEVRPLVITAAISGILATLISRNFFGNEKKITHPIITDYDVRDDTFCRTMSQLLGPPLLDGNEVKILQNGAEIFPAMLDAIASAKVSITFENFVFTEGRIVWQFAAALAERAAAGVKVHFLQDAMGSDCIHHKVMRLLKESGVEVEIFRYVGLAHFNQRTHRKLLTIDGRLGFIGGVGISDIWDGNGDQRGIWRDTQYQIKGPVVAQMQQAFIDNWMQTRATVLHGDDYFPALQSVGNLACQVFKSSADEGADSARLIFLFSIACARKTIKIANAYFIPDDLLLDTLVKACERGVIVEIITTGEDTDQPTVRLIGRSRWGKLLEAGARFYEFQPARFHCKYMIVDDLWTSVGSCNFDNRSLRLNDEANLNVYSEDFGREHAVIFEEDKRKSKEVTFEAWQSRPLKEKVIGNLASVMRSQV